MERLVKFPDGITFEMCETLGSCLCRHFEIHKGTLSIINKAKQGGYLALDLVVRSEGREYNCHARLTNSTAAPIIKDGFLAEKIVNHTRYREAIRPYANWNYPIAA